MIFKKKRNKDFFFLIFLILCFSFFTWKLIPSITTKKVSQRCIRYCNQTQKNFLENQSKKNNIALDPLERGEEDQNKMKDLFRYFIEREKIELDHSHLNSPLRKCGNQKIKNNTTKIFFASKKIKKKKKNK